MFADAEVGLREAKTVIFGVCYEGTVTFRKGTSKAPQAIREESCNFESYSCEHKVDLSKARVFDAGDVGPFRKPEEMAMAVGKRAAELCEGKFLVMLGGEHSVSPPVLRAVAAPGVIVIDAHLDFRDEYHGSRLNHACASRRFADVVGAENIYQIGIRSLCKEELQDARELGLRFATAIDVREEGIQKVVDEALRAVKRRPLYLSIDIDGVDPAYAPGTGTPEPWGITSWDLKHVVDRVAPLCSGMDVVEVSPACDNGNTASLAAKVVREAIAVRMMK